MMQKNLPTNQTAKSYLTRMQAKKNLSSVVMKIAQLIQMSLTFKYRNEQSQLAKDNVFIDLISNNKTHKHHMVANVIH